MKGESCSNNYGGKKVLVAGGSGLVGCNLTKEIISRGYDVLSSYYPTKPDFLQKHYKYFDFTKYEECVEATKGCSCVFMCAAQTYGVKLMREKPTASILPNLKISVGLLEACAQNKVGKIVMITSSTAYPEAQYPIKEEEMDLNVPPYDLYFGVGWFNRYLEKLAELYSRTYGMKIGIVRTTNVYGPHDTFDDEKSHVLPALIKRALKKEEPFIIWGDGAVIRDFIYVEDLVGDLLNVADKYCICDPINIGSGVECTVKDAVNTVLQVTGHDIKPVYDATKPMAILYRMLDMTKYRSVFGEPKRMPLEDGIRKTVDWYLSQTNGK